MTRGGRDRARDAPERRCVVTGERGGVEGLIRFVLSPDGVATPDLAERLPGRGLWITASRDCVARAAAKGGFARGFRQAAAPPPDLLDGLERGLLRRVVEALGLANKAGLAVVGFEKVKARLKAGPVAALLQAADGSRDQRAKLRPMAGEAPVLAVLTAQELGLAFRREFVIHASLDAGGAADRVVREARRLAGIRSSEAG